MRILRSITIKKASSRRSLMSLCYKTISSCCSCAHVEILSTWEVWRALKRLKLHSAAPGATLTPLSCSPNFPRAQYLDIRTLTHELIVKNVSNGQVEAPLKLVLRMKDLLLRVHVVVKTLNLEISRCHLADYVKEL